MTTLDQLTQAIISRCSADRGSPALLVGLSGIDSAGKGYLAGRLHARLAQAGLTVAALTVDGWLELPGARFSDVNPGEHFYRHALRLDRMFAELVLPLRRHRSVEVIAEHAEETATAFRECRYAFRDVDVVLLEGIFIFKRAYRAHFDLAVWVDCTFETALERALIRAQEGLPPAATREAYRRIYFPAQRLHLERDDPRSSADVIVRTMRGSSCRRRRASFLPVHSQGAPRCFDG